MLFFEEKKNNEAWFLMCSYLFSYICIKTNMSFENGKTWLIDLNKSLCSNGASDKMEHCCLIFCDFKSNIAPVWQVRPLHTINCNAYPLQNCFRYIPSNIFGCSVRLPELRHLCICSFKILFVYNANKMQNLLFYYHTK